MFDSAKAINFAINELKNNFKWRDISTKQKELLSYDYPAAELVLFRTKYGKVFLCNDINIRPNFLETLKLMQKMVVLFSSGIGPSKEEIQAIQINKILKSLIIP